MVTLGVAPPYAIEDVKTAYREKVRLAHPDHGGSNAAFYEIHQAFERAEAYLEFRTDRRAWIASNMSHYAALQKAMDRLHRLGATVTTKAPQWLEQSFGDFAQLTETVNGIRLEGAANGDALITALVDDYKPLRELEVLELPGTRVSDDSVLCLGIFKQLKRLDLSNTPITRRGLAVIDALANLEAVNLNGAKVGWWDRLWVQTRLRRRTHSG